MLSALALLVASHAQGAITVTRTSGNIFYTDTKTTSPGVPRCGYVSFNIRSSAPINDAWATIGSFSGGLFSLGGGDDGIFHFGPFAAGQSKPAFYYLCSSYNNLNESPSQSYDIKVYSGNPAAGGTQEGSANFSTRIDNDVIQANPNQVNVIISGPNPATIGGIVTMTVDGDTGTIGCVNPPSTCTGNSGGPLAFTPATFTSWRADAFEMVGSTINFSGGNSESYDNTLYVDQLPTSATSHYLATYYFRAVGATGVTTTLSPVSYLASGTQIKHTSLSSGAYTIAGGLQPVESPQASVVLLKTVSHATLPAQGGRVTYTLSATNSGLAEVSLDSFIDLLPGGASYVAGSSTFNGAAMPDPGLSGSTLTWSSLYAIPAATTRRLVFQADLPATPGSYTNSASARIGSSVIDSTLQLTDNAPATAGTVVLQAPTVSASFLPTSVAVNGIAALTLTIANPNAAQTMNGIALSNTLPASPAGLGFASPTGAATTCPGATVSLTGSTIQITGGTLAAGQSCIVTANVTSASVNASYTNTTGAVSSTNCGTGGSASASVVFTSKPTITKSFNVPTIRQNGTATMTIAINNSAALTGVSFDDLFPAGLVTANPPSVTPASPCGGVLSSWNGVAAAAISASGGDSGIRLTGGAIPAGGGSCSFTVNVTAAAAGVYANTAGGVYANETGILGPASNTAVLSVLSPPSVAKVFAPSTIGKGQSSTLTVTLSNANATAISGVAFTDTFPANVTTSTTPKAATTCPGGTVSFTGNSVSLSGGSIPASGSCTVVIDVRSDVVNNAGYLNSIGAGAVTSSNAGSNSTAATASLFVNATPTIAKSFSFNGATGVATMTISITNNHTAGISGLSFTDLFPAGMTTANPPALSPSTPCGSGSAVRSWNGSSPGTLSGTGGDSGIMLTAGQIPAAGGSCSFSVNLSINAVGVYTNQASGVTLSAPFTGTGSPSNAAVWIAPLVSKTFTPNTVGPGDASRMVIRITNPSSSTSLTGVALADLYPTTATRPDGSILAAAMTNSATPNVSSNCGGSVSAAANGSGISLAGASLAPGAVCTMSVDVRAVNTTPATYYNTTGRVAANQGIGGQSSDALYLITKPTITKAFLPSSVTLSGGTATSVMRISVKNNTSLNITGVSLTDSFPAQMRWVNTVANSCGGSLTDAAGALLVANSSTGIKLSNGAIGAAGTCSIDVTVSVSAPGKYDNTTSGATSSANASPGSASNTATLSAYLLAPSVSKTFAQSAFQAGGANRLTITLGNPNTTAITGVTFTDSYPANLLNAAVPNLVSSCGGTATATPESDTLSLTGGVIPASGSCSLSIDLTAEVTGSYSNTILANSVTSTNANPAPAADVSATSTAYLPPVSSKAFGTAAIAVGATTSMTLTLTNPAVNPGAITGLRLDDSFPGGQMLKNTSFSFAPAACGTVTKLSGAASAAGDSALRFSVASLAPGASCQVTVSVTSSSAGSITNATNAATATGPAALTGVGANASLTIYHLPLISILKSADMGSADPGQVVLYTVQIVNTGAGVGTEVVLTDDLSPYGAFYLGAGTPFSITDSSPASGVSLGTPQYSNNKGATWLYAPVSGGGGAPAGYDGTVTNWRVPMIGSIRAGGNFLLRYRVVVK